MGTIIQLAVGNLEIDWGKNNRYTDHAPLFQGEHDVVPLPYFYAGEDSDWAVEDEEPFFEVKEGLSKPLSLVAERLNLLGHTFAQCEREYEYVTTLSGFDRKLCPFTVFSRAMADVDVAGMSNLYTDDHSFGSFFRQEIAPRLDIAKHFVSNYDQLMRLSEAMENISAYSVLQLLAQNSRARCLPVQWFFYDPVREGYARRHEFVRSLSARERFLIVTEGSSDTKILRHALELLKPHVVDFFEFVDMQEGYPFSGTGNMYRFLQGLIAISVQNRIVFLFDNDAEGVFNYSRCKDLNPPANISIVKLPDIEHFARFKTTGPSGEHLSNINGAAAAIECYLDLDDSARVRWTSYNSQINVYQGELEGKTKIARTFLDQRSRAASYDYSRLEGVLDLLIRESISMREFEVSSDFRKYELD